MHQTRMMAMGKRPLMEGYALLGFEVWPDAELEQLETILEQLMHTDQKALILIESYLSRAASPILKKTRKNGGKIIITEIPAINAAGDYHPYVEDLIVQVMGQHAVDKENER